MNVMARPWRHLFDFRGRASRIEYWLYHIVALVGLIAVQALFGLIISMIDMRAGTARSTPNAATGVAAAIAVLVYGVGFILLGIGHLSVTIRRIHDQGDPWLKYLLTFIPLVGIVFWAIIAFKAGDEGENDYGYDPREPEPLGESELHEVFS